MGAADINRNGVDDATELAEGRLADCDADGLPDLAEILDGREPDLNGNRRLDSCDIADGTSQDVDGDGVPDEAQPDCNQNSIPDAYEVATGQASDCDGDGVPDACDLARPALALGTPEHWASGGAPESIHAADLNGDGLEDLLLLNRVGGEPVLDVFLERGIVGFERLPPLTLAAFPSSLAVRELSRDGIADVVWIGQGAAHVLHGVGDGTFQEAQVLPLGGQANGPLFADVDGDAVLDLIIGGHEKHEVRVHTGLANGTFATGRAFRVGSSPFLVAVEDLNGDRLPDLALREDSQAVLLVMPGDGAGGFGEPTSSALAEVAAATLLADLNGDGRLDALVALRGARSAPPGGIAILEGAGDGTFVEVSRAPFLLLANSLQLVDVNHDAALDLLVTSASPGTVSVLLSRGGLDFTPARHYLAGQGTDSAVLLDRGGSLQLVAANEGSGDLSTLSVEASGRLVAPLFLPARGGDLVAADVTGDGWTDLVLTDDGGLAILLGGEEGAYPRVFVPTDDVPISVAAGDLNGDGLLDLAVAHSRESFTVSILLSRGGGLFEPAAGVPVATDQVSVTLADLDRDDRLDLLVMTRPAPWVLRGKGDGSFEPGWPIPGYSAPDTFTLGDFDGNDRLDLALGYCCMTQINLVLGQADGPFQSFQPGGAVRLVGAGTEGLASADIDGDGFADLVATQRDLDSVVTLLGSGDGSFQRLSPVPVQGRGPISLALLDLDGDGRLDLVTGDFANGSPGGISLFRGSGDGAFEPAGGVPLGKGVGHLTAVDLDRDGVPDLVTSIGSPSGVLLIGNRTAKPRDRDCNQNGIPDRCDLAAGTLADTNHDGLPDLCQVGGCQIPGDANQDGRLDLTDAVTVLRYLFQGAPTLLPCGDGSRRDPANRKLLDWQPDGAIDLTDAVGNLLYLFQGGPPHAMAAPGADTTDCVYMEGCPALPGVERH